MHVGVAGEKPGGVPVVPGALVLGHMPGRQGVLVCVDVLAGEGEGEGEGVIVQRVPGKAAVAVSEGVDEDLPAGVEEGVCAAVPFECCPACRQLLLHLSCQRVAVHSPEKHSLRLVIKPAKVYSALRVVQQDPPAEATRQVAHVGCCHLACPALQVSAASGLQWNHCHKRKSVA